MAEEIQMPRYKCHKTVHALRIKEVQVNDDCSGVLAFSDEGYAPLPLDSAFMHKHLPKPGGYYVVYEDGYASFSPAKAFEDGYTRI